MKIHYLNARGEEVFIDNVIHLQNVDNYTWVAATKSGKELTLRTDRIEGIADMHELGGSIMQKDKSNEQVVDRYVIAEGLEPNAFCIDFRNKSAILILDGQTCDLSELDVSKYDYFIINGVSYKKEQK